jgi:acetoacetyl-CoA synthetase
MRTPLWTPSTELIQQSNITHFIAAVNARYHKNLQSYNDLYRWSVEAVPDFWAALWDFAGIIASHPYDTVVEDLSVFPGARWFPGARLNFAENLLRFRDDHPALIFHGETHASFTLTYRQLYESVVRFALSLQDLGVRAGDRVAAYMPNRPETVTAMLAASSLGAVWSSCATDIGAPAALERLGQVEPKVLLTCDGYYYKGKPIDTLPNAAQVARGIPSLQKTILVPYLSAQPDLSSIPNSVLYEDFLSSRPPAELEFAQLPFDQPHYIMFSSGTTGKPKCLVQGAGGVLLNHLKELILHTDLRRDDTIFYITSCSWMMWNWLISSLAVGATLVLYDGNPNYPDASAMWKLIEEERVTIFGCSASYLHLLKKQGELPSRFDLGSLREISQTGSPLSVEGFEYVYRAIKADVHLNSISGGTDINGCFVAGSPILPVYAGELQSPALAMKIAAYDPSGQPVVDEQGELVCEKPAPSMPLYFWNDPDGTKYQRAYFDFYQGVWRHGDTILIHSDTGGITFYGRSDAVLKPSGVRIGTAEIYAQMEKLPELVDSLAIGQEHLGDQRVILFVKLAPGIELTDPLKDKIRRSLRENASPHHVPALIIAAPDIPYTLNMKKVESSVTNLLNHREVTNRDALINPACLDFFDNLVDELSR